MIRPIQCIWILLLLCHTACNGCKQYEIANETIEWGADIVIDASGGGITPLGHINGLPVLPLRGTISKNLPGVDTAFLCAMFVPDGAVPDASATVIQGHSVKIDAQDASSNGLPVKQLHALDSGGFVYYERPLQPGETGSVDFSVVSSGVADHSLALGTTYDIYLGIKVGPHFFYTSNACVKHRISDKSSLMQITMDSAQCVRAHDGTNVVPELSAEATVTNSLTAYTAGFLYVKQGSGHTPSGLFAKQIVEGTSLSANIDQLEAHIGSDVVICGAANTFAIKDVQDTTAVLEKGATYDVYGYVEDGTHYFVSTDSQAVTLPVVDIQVSMESVGAPSLLAEIQNTGDSDVSEYQVVLEGKIEKIENAQDPVAGFVFVKNGQQMDKKAICNAIQGSITPSSTVRNVIDCNNDQNHIVCIAKNTGLGVETTQYTCNLQENNTSKLDLSSDYTVHFWVKDLNGNGELFLSSSSKNYKTLKLIGDGITAVDSASAFNNLIINLTATPDSCAGNRDIVFRKESDSSYFSLAALRTQLMHPDKQQPYATFPFQDPLRLTNGTDLKAKTLYNLGLAVWGGSVLYYIPGTCTYQTPDFVKNTSTRKMTTLQSNEKVELQDKPSHKAFLQNGDGSTSILNPQESSDRTKIREALKKTHTGDALDQAYINFGIQNNIP